MTGEVSQRDLFLLGLGLYWGEGYKGGNSELGFTNSDSDMVKIFLKWLRTIYEIHKSSLILRVSINDIHKDRIHIVTKYWANVTNVSISQFTKPSFTKTSLKKKYPNHEHYFGILRVKVRRGSRLKQRILGSLAAIKA
jgi:hypothetical protein